RRDFHGRRAGTVAAPGRRGALRRDKIGAVGGLRLGSEVLMEAYPSITDLLSRSPNPAIAVFIPIFIATTLLEMVVLLIRNKTYPWKNAGVSTLMAIGHFITQAAAHGVIFGIIAAFVYKVHLTTIPVSFGHWGTLTLLFLLVDLAFYIEHRCSH